MKFRFILFLLIFAQAGPGSFCSKLHAAPDARTTVDSLYRILNASSTSDDTVKVKLLNLIAFNHRLLNYDTGITVARKALDMAQSAGWKEGMAVSYINLSMLYRLKSQFAEALEYGFNGLRLSEQTHDELRIGTACAHIGVVYQYQKQYNEAIKYETRALNIYKKTGNKVRAAMQLGDIATLYWVIKKYDSALAANFKSLETLTELGNAYEIARTNDNIGMIYGDMGNYPKALEYEFRSLAGLKKTGVSNRSIGICYYNIGDAYLHIARDTVKTFHDPMIPEDRSRILALAASYTDSSISIFRQLSDRDDEVDAHGNMAAIAELQGNYKQGYEHYKQHIALRDSVFSTENKVRIAQAEAKYQLEIVKLELANKKNQRNFLIVAIVLLCIITILFISKQRAEKKKLESEKESAEKLLEGFRNSISEKNVIIEQITEEIQRMTGKNAEEEEIEILAQLQRAIILTDEQWDEFQVLFEKAHKNFFASLRKKIPDLTPSETRLLALTKLKLSSKEMAAMMGISPNTIRIYRHRLRKKLDLGDEEMIDELVENI